MEDIKIHMGNRTWIVRQTMDGKFLLKRPGFAARRTPWQTIETLWAHPTYTLECKTQSDSRSRLAYTVSRIEYGQRELSHFVIADSVMMEVSYPHSYHEEYYRDMTASNEARAERRRREEQAHASRMSAWELELINAASSIGQPANYRIVYPL